jgi:hypothetical protein
MLSSSPPSLPRSWRHPPDRNPGALDLSTSFHNLVRDARAAGSGSLVSKAGTSKGAVAAVSGDALACDFAVTNPSSSVGIPGASLVAGRARAVLYCTVLRCVVSCCVVSCCAGLCCIVL